MRRRLVIAAIALAAVALIARAIVVVPHLPESVTAAHFETLRTDLPRMRAFLATMPKGGDLHTHLSGAVYAERLIAWGVKDGVCLRRAEMRLLTPPASAPPEAPCGTDPGTVPLAEAIGGPQGQSTYDLLLDALSMRWFLRTPAVPSGHDQFFGTFGRFDPTTGGPDWDTTAQRTAEMVVDQLRQYDASSVQYAELMVTLFFGSERRALAQGLDPAADPATLLETVNRNGLPDLVRTRTGQVADLVRRIEALRACPAPSEEAAAPHKPGCGVTYRFIAQVNRNSPPAEVFAQTALSAALVRAMPDVVAGLNYVGPEDYRISLRDYRTHMKWIGFLSGRDVPVALHAGELWLGLVPPPDLDFHIREAVETAGARRIGHGTALPFERDMAGLLKEMRARGVTVEIALTSSDVILGVRGREHPLPTYLAAGVPVVLATDDAGVSRIDLTNEYLRAARDHGLGYRTLKGLAHNALTHAFLKTEEKERQLAKLDRAFAAFEQSAADALPPLAKARALLLALVP
ncbi:adenosine deaminase [Xanthobacter sediminis]